MKVIKPRERSPKREVLDKLTEFVNSNGLPDPPPISDRVVVVRECAVLESRKRKKKGLYTDIDLNLSEEFHVGFSVYILDEPVSIPSHVAEEENWKLIAVCTPLRPGHAMQE